MPNTHHNGSKRTRRRISLAAAGLALGALALTLAPAGGGGSAAQAAAGPATGRSLSDACGTLVPKATGGYWECSFVDNFSGKAIDTRKWLVAETPTSGFHMGVTCFDDRNAFVRSGTLQMVARDEGQTFTCESPVAPFDTRYTGAHLATSYRFSQTYGRFEVRARYPSTGPGIHGGFWLYPQKHTYGAWPKSGEIDVAEWWSNEPTYVVPSLVYEGRDFSIASVDTGWGCRVADPTQFHTYTAEWGTTVMRFYIDGALCFERSWTPADPLVAPQPFDHPFNIILTNSVDGPSGPNAVGAGTVFPATYVVDYVRAWK